MTLTLTGTVFTAYTDGSWQSSLYRDGRLLATTYGGSSAGSLVTALSELAELAPVGSQVECRSTIGTYLLTVSVQTAESIHATTGPGAKVLVVE